MFFRKKPKPESPVVHAADDTFARLVFESDGVTVVDFWASWCAPCRMMEPILEEIAVEFRERGVRVVKVDTDRAPATAEQFEIRSIPTLVFFQDGEPLFQTTGLVSKPVLERELNAVLRGRPSSS